jgi:uncharacterized membrane protein (UPF0127 family)
MFVKIGKNQFNVKTLVTPKEQRIGMMRKKFDDSFDGMLFLMGGDDQCFWMKNCIIPLDILIIRNNVIVNIHHDCPPCNDDDCPSYCGNGNIVLELEGGTCEELGIEPGDVINYVF